MQYCPQCLLEDGDPYFRKEWRVAFITTCTRHQCMLRDRCMECGAGVAFHRGDMGSPESQHRDSISDCYACGASLAAKLANPIECYDQETMDWISQISHTVSVGTQRPDMLDSINVMRHMALLLASRFATVKLHAYVCNEIAVPEMPLERGPISFESRELDVRHHLIQLAGWLMVDLEPRLRSAWRAKALRYNHMLKDFERAPKSYLKVVEGFSDWRRS